MITAILLIFSILWIVDLGGMIIEINISKAIILAIATTEILMISSYEEKSVMFVVKKIITQTSIQMMSNGRQKNFRDKIKDFTEIKTNTTHF